jgi:hypothetical protein
MKLRQRILSRRKRYAYIARWSDFRRQPFICFEQEMTIEEAKRRFGYTAPEGAVGVKIGYSVHRPLEVDVCVRRQQNGR